MTPESYVILLVKENVVLFKKMTSLMDYFIFGVALCPIQEVLSQDDNGSQAEPMAS